MKNHIAGKKLTSKETARVLGASEASVKRWADGGLLPSEKTAGGHRRFRPEDVALFRRGQKSRSVNAPRLNAVNASASPPARGGQTVKTKRALEGDEKLAEALSGALIGGEMEEVSALLVKSYLEGMTLASIFDHLLSGAMRKIGDLWQRGELTVAQEHLATRAALSALQTLDKVSDEAEANNLLVVCCGIEDDFHELPVRCAELILKHAGWEVLNLGANTPFYALTEMVTRLHPQLACVGSTIFGNLDRAVREFAELRVAAERVGTAIVLGGAGFADANIRCRLPAELHADSFQELLDFADSLATMKQMPDAAQ